MTDKTDEPRVYLVPLKDAYLPPVKENWNFIGLEWKLDILFKNIKELFGDEAQVTIVSRGDDYCVMNLFGGEIDIGSLDGDPQNMHVRSPEYREKAERLAERLVEDYHQNIGVALSYIPRSKDY